MNQAINDCLAGLNGIGKTFCSHAAGAFIQSALLVILLFAIDLLLRRRVRAVFRYCVWLLVLVKLVLPPTLSLPTGVGYWVGDRIPAASGPVHRFPPQAVTSAGPASTREGEKVRTEKGRSALLPSDLPIFPPSSPSETSSLTPITWQAVVFLLWLVGVLAFGLLLAQRLRFVRGLVAASIPAGGEQLDLLEQCRRQMGVRRQVGLRTLDTLPSPAVCGLRRPIILMPALLVEKLSPEGLRAALIHELAHIQRADLWVNAVQTFLQVVYFYNPFVWFANAIIRRTCEEAVDETVLVTLGGEAKSYSNTLIDIGEMAFWKADFGLRLVGVAESRKALQGRIKHMLTRPVPQSARIGALGTIAILVIAAVLLPMARAERSSKEAPTTGPVAGAEATEKAPVAGESDTVVDPNTGLKIVLAKTIAGANNLIEHLNKLTLSPDGRFLLWWGRVVPLDGTEAFRSGYECEVAVSPNGRYVAHGGRDDAVVWLQPVSPETLRPSGPSKKLLDLKGGLLLGAWGRSEAIHWTRDSETLFFRTRDAKGKEQQHAFSAVTGAPVSFPDAMARGLLSPDGKCVAFTEGNPGFWVQTAGEGAARNLCSEGPAPLCWSGDGHWLISIGRGGGVVRFVRYPDGQEYLVSLPRELERSSACVGASPDKKKLFFYQPGYELKNRIKVASAENAPLVDVDGKAPYAGVGNFTWAPDGKAILSALYAGSRQVALIARPLSGEEPVPFTISTAVSGMVTPFSVSPNGKWLLFGGALQPDTGMFDLAVAPLSMADHEVNGPATVVFRQAPRPADAAAWSPDSTRVALVSRADPGDQKGIWIASTDGRAPLRLTGTTGSERDLQWSPDASMLAFVSGSAEARELKVVPTTGGETMTIRKWNADDNNLQWAWSPDSKSLTLAEKGMLIRQPLSGGRAESMVNLKESGVEKTWWLSWSPDGGRLVLMCPKEDLRVWGQLLFARVEEGRLLRTATVDLKGGSWDYVWSPDSKSVAYGCEDAVVVRPVGRLYALAVEDVLEKISTGAIAPTRKPTAPPAVEKPPTETRVIPPAEPIVGPAFSDNFDHGLSQYWRIVDSNQETSPPPAHAVENGRLMLSNASARLDQIDWTDYVVTARVCMKESIASGEAVFGIQTRTTPCAFGIKNRDRYNFVITCLDGRPTGLYLGINYRDPSNTAQNANLDRSPYTIIPDKWYTLEFEVRGQHLRGSLDGKLMVEATDERLSKGGIWLGAWRTRALFDDFSVRLLP